MRPRFRGFCRCRQCQQHQQRLSQGAPGPNKEEKDTDESYTGHRHEPAGQHHKQDPGGKSHLAFRSDGGHSEQHKNVIGPLPASAQVLKSHTGSFVILERRE